MPTKQRLTDEQKQAILWHLKAGQSCDEIGKKLNLDGRIVSGLKAAALADGRLPASLGIARSAPPNPEDQLKALAKAWKDSEPDAEFSIHTQKGQKVYIATYKDGVVLRIGEQKKVALLTSFMASRLGMKLGEMAHWSRGFAQAPMPPPPRVR